jgi:hypothetical protein
MILLGFLWKGKAKAQGGLSFKKVKPEEVCVRTVGALAFKLVDPPVISGSVVDEKTGAPVPFATVSFKKGKMISADSAGRFTLERPESKRTEELMATAVGSSDQRIKIGTINTGAVTIYMVAQVEELDAVEVMAFAPFKQTECTNMLQGFAGGLTISEKVTTAEKITRVWKEFLPKKEVIAYPNPLAPGNIMKVALQLKETGRYRMQLIDASGRIVWIQSVNIPSKQYNFSIPTQNTWSAGVYWLRISGTHTRNIYNGKVVIQ